MPVTQPHGRAAVPRERGVDRVLPQDGTVYRVRRVRGTRADHVRRVDVLDVHAEIRLHVRVDFVLKKFRKVLQHRIPARVRLANLPQYVLPRALRDDDDAVLFPVQHAPDVREDAAGSLQRRVNLRDEAHVNLARRQARVHRDEAARSTHETHETDAVHRGSRFDRGGADRLDRLVHRGVEPERSVEEEDVVVDRLRATSVRRGGVVERRQGWS